MAEAAGGGRQRWKEAPWLLQPLLSCPAHGVLKVLDTGSGQEKAEEGQLPSSFPSHKPTGYLCPLPAPCLPIRVTLVRKGKRWFQNQGFGFQSQFSLAV